MSPARQHCAPGPGGPGDAHCVAKDVAVAQQDCPFAPQATQVFDEMLQSPAPLHVLPEQHFPPGKPHVQTPLWQSPLLHTVPSGLLVYPQPVEGLQAGTVASLHSVGAAQVIGSMPVQVPLTQLSAWVQTLLSVQNVPSDLLVPWSMQTETPVEQEVLPL